MNKVYPNGYHAAYDVNLDIADGEFICLVGSSGCGKTTILRMVAGLDEITSGDFYIDGVRANDQTSRERGIAMVFQSYALYPHMTVYENLAFSLVLEGADADTIEEKVQQTAKILGITQYLDRFPRQLSGGQQQRVAVGRALIRKVRIFLMDEPLSNLDAKQRVTMRSEIKQIHRAVGATTIYVTHDQTEAMTMSDRIVVMDIGHIKQVGTPYELYFYPANKFVAAFIGDPPMNFMEGEVEDGKFVCEKAPGFTFDVAKVCDDPEALEGKDIWFAFRPEAIKLPVHDTEDSPKDRIEFTSKVELTELLGDTTNVYGIVGETETEDGQKSDKNVNVILKINPHDTPEVGGQFDFYIPYRAAYLFDKETEEVIPWKVDRHG